MWMIKADRERAKETIEIDQAMAVRSVHQVRAAALFQIENDLETIEQNVFAERVENALRSKSRFFNRNASAQAVRRWNSFSLATLRSSKVGAAATILETFSNP